MKPIQLFLFGGNPPFTDKLGKQFSEAITAAGGQVGILFIERAGWERYMPLYTGVLENNGISSYAFIPLSAEPTKAMLADLNRCSGFIIGGGETERYRNYIVETPVGGLIKEKYHAGAPVAGFSAGALIAPEHCVIPPVDTGKNRQLFLNGLGLIAGCVVSVHYSKWQEEENLKRALRYTGSSLGIGIDDGAGIRFVNGQAAEAEGPQLVQFRSEDMESEEDSFQE